jgi:predicted RNA-binding protein YlxR (DUF448 family)
MPKRRPDHIPMRTCAVCRQVRPKRAMTRIVRGADGTVAIDRTGRASGRGTYVCDDPACREPNQLAAAVQRALSVQIAPGTLNLEEIHATS